MSPAGSLLRRLLVFAGLAALAIGTWRSFPTIEEDPESRPALRVVLFDLSGGTTRQRPAHGLWARKQLQREARRAVELGEELAVAIYGRDVRSLGLAAPEEWLARLAGQRGELLQLRFDQQAEAASELDPALGLFEAQLCDARRPSRTLVICGLKDYTGLDPRPRLARLARSGVDLEWIEPGPPPLPDLAIEGLRLPTLPAPGAPLVAVVDLALVGSTETRGSASADRLLQLSFELNAGGRLSHGTLGLAPPTGAAHEDGVLRWSVRLELGSVLPGRSAVAVRAGFVDPTGVALPDPIPENDGQSGEFRSGELRLIGAVANKASHAALRDWIGSDPSRWAGLQWRILEPAELPGALGELDLIVSFDLGPADLPANLVKSFVRTGGGWLFCAGWGALSGWFPTSAAGSGDLSELLPLWPAPDGGAPRDVIFLVDGSGSMAGEAFERVQGALAQLVLSVPAEDRLALRFFTGSLQPALDLRIGEAGVREILKQLFEVRVPGGQTAILYCLDQLVAERGRAPDESLVFLLTDGKEVNAFKTAERGKAIASALCRGESRFVVVTAGPNPDRGFLRNLLPPGEQLVEAGLLGNLAEIFQREIFERRLREGVMPRVETGTPEEASGDLIAAWSTSSGDWPRMERSLRCEARPNAQVLLRGEPGGEPVLAWQRVGRGRVAAWSSVPLDGWAPAYRTADDRIGPLLRWLARVASDEQRLDFQTNANQLELRGVPEHWPARIEAIFYAQLQGTAPAGWTQELEVGRGVLQASAGRVGLDPRQLRFGELPPLLSERGRGEPMSVVLLSPESGEVLGQVGLRLPCEQEYGPARRTPVDLSGLAEWARRAVPLAPPVQAPDPLAWAWVASGVCVLSLAALLGGLGRSLRS